MKKPTIQKSTKFLTLFLLLLVAQFSAFAQEIKVDEKDVSNWFARNWMWVAAAVVLLILIILFSGSTRRRKTTTVVQDEYGNVKSVTTTEIKD